MSEDTRTTAEKRAAFAHEPITLSVRLTSTCPHGKASNKCCGYAEWLQVIHKVNEHHPGSFGEPLAMYDWWAGGWCEEYLNFRVLIRTDGTTNIQAKTDDAKAVLKTALLDVTGRAFDDNGIPQ